MGSGLFDSNYIEEDHIEEEEKEDNFLSSAEEEENDNSQSEDNNSEVEFKRPFKKPKYNFYLNKSFLSSSSLKEDDKYKIKQMYAIKRINFIIKITRDFLDRKYHRKNSIEDQKDVLRKNPTFSNLKSKTALNTYNYENNEIEKISTKKNLFSYNNIVNKEINENEQKNIKLIRHTIYTSSRKRKKGFHIINLGENSRMLGKYIKNIYYTKTYFDNNDVFNSFSDLTKTKNYGIYYYYKIGCVYEGYWENNTKTDIGIEKRWDGTKYEGEYVDGKKNGIGVYTWKDNSIYFGEWVNNNINGYGVFKNCDKSKYQGEFLLNKRNGYGELFKYKTGTFYFGYWNNNKKKGFGIEFTPRNNGNHKLYIGFWKGKYRHGFGVLLNKRKKNENIYGLWKDNKNTKNFNNIIEFKNKISSSGFSNYIPFYDKTYEEYEDIIKIMVDSSEFNRNYFS
jgi:hypothetical protein